MASPLLLSPMSRQGLEQLLINLISLLSDLGLHQGVTQYDCLSKNETFWVARITLEDNSSIIIKHVHPEAYPSIYLPAPWVEECVVYEFLERHVPTFKQRPRVLYQARGILLLEDLTTSIIPESKASLNSIAYTLACFHQNTHGKEEILQQLRISNGLPKAPPRIIPNAVEIERFNRGLIHLQALGVNCGSEAEILSILNTPYPYWGLVHTELASARNMVYTNRGVYLLDFERARYGSGLIDVAIAMIGRLEWSNREGGTVLNHLNGDLEFATCYRTAYEGVSGESVDDHIWQSALRAALIFVSAIAFGDAEAMLPQYPAAISRQAIEDSILDRLCLCSRHSAG